MLLSAAQSSVRFSPLRPPKAQDFKAYEAGLIRIAQQALRLLLSPAGKEVRFQSKAAASAQDLLSYFAEHNHRFKAKIVALKDDRAPPFNEQIARQFHQQYQAKARTCRGRGRWHPKGDRVDPLGRLGETHFGLESPCYARIRRQ